MPEKITIAMVTYKNHYFPCSVYKKYLSEMIGISLVFT